MGLGWVNRGSLRLRSYFFIPPSKEAPAAMVCTAARFTVPEEAGRAVCRAVLVAARCSMTEARTPRAETASRTTWEKSMVTVVNRRFTRRGNDVEIQSREPEGAGGL